MAEAATLTSTGHWPRRSSALATVVTSLLLTGCPLTDDYFLESSTNGAAGNGMSARGGTGMGGRGQSGNGTAIAGRTDSGTDAGGAGSNGGAGGSSDSGAAGNGEGGSNTTGQAGTTNSGSAGGGNRPNLIMNPGFENGTTGWGVHGTVVGLNATISSSTLVSHSGSRSLMISGRTQSYQGPVYSLTGLVTTGKSYAGGVWVRLPAGLADAPGFNLTLRLLCSSGANEYFPWVYNATVSSLRWTQLTATNTLSGCTSGTINGVDLYVEGPATIYAFYIDDVFFELI